MKKCPFCGAELNDDCLFCTECGKELPKGNACPHCGAQTNDNDVFCENCGKRIDEVDKDTESKQFQQITSPIEKSENGDILEEYEEKPSPIKQYKSYIIGLLALFALVGSWYGYNAYSEYSAVKYAREKYVADSLNRVKQDSIQLANQQEKEKQDKARFEEFVKKMTFDNLVNLLNHYDDVGEAKKCGLSLIYKDVENDGDIECVDVVYGYDVEKKGKKDIVAMTDYAFYLQYVLDGSTHAIIYTKNGDLMGKLNSQADEYGLIKYDGNQFVPKQKLPNGTIYADSLDWGGDYAPIYMWGLSRFDDEKQWFVCDIGIDF